MNDQATSLDFTRRLLAGPSFNSFIPLAGVGTTDEPAWTYAVKQADTKIDAGKMTISGSLTVEEPDRAKEILVLDGMDLSGFQRNPIGLFQHDRFKPVGRFVDDSGKFTVVRRGKSVDGTLHLVQKGPMAPLAEQVFGLVESKLLNGWSPGFMSHWKDYRRVSEGVTSPGQAVSEEKSVVRIEHWRPFEWSLVFVPENDRSLVTQVVRKGLSTGSGYKSLLPQLAQALAPFVEPTPEWVPGIDLPTKTEEEIQREKQVSQTTTSTGPTNGVVEVIKEVVKEVRVEVIPERVKELADQGEWYSKHVVRDLGLPLGDYRGKPGEKALRAAHDAAMFNALSILRTLEEIDGPAEKSLADAALAQERLAAEMVDAYKSLYGNGQDPEWAAVTASDLYQLTIDKKDATEVTKELTDRAVAWSARSNAWGKHHALRCKTAADALDLVGGKAEALKPDEREKCLAAAKNLRAMLTDRGTIDPLEEEREKELQAINDKIAELVKTNQRLERELRNARRGSF